MFEAMRTKIFLSLVFAVLASAVLGFVDSVRYTDAVAAERAEVRQKLSEIMSKLESQMGLATSLVNGLEVLVLTKPQMTQQEFDAVASKMMSGTPNIRNLSVAPENVIKFIYPIKGNEAAIGVDIASLPQQKTTVIKSIEQKKMVVAGPVDLVQGGRAFLARLPVFLDSGYWGFVSVAIDLDRLFRSVGIGDPRVGLKIAMRGKDGLGESGEHFYGDVDMLAKKPESMEITLSQGSWVIYALPAGGWHTRSFFALSMMPLGGGIAVFVLSMFFLHRRDQNMSLKALLNEERSAHRQTGEELKSSADRFAYMLENMPVMISAVDRKGNFVLWNKECERVLGFSAQEMIGNAKAIELLFGDDLYRAKMFTEYQRIGRDYRNLEWELLTKDGGKKMISLSSIAASCPILEYQGGWGIGIDITEQKKAQEALQVLNSMLEDRVGEESEKRQESESLFRTVYDKYALGLAVVDMQHRIVDANLALHRIFGYEDRELIGKVESELLDKEEYQQVSEEMDRLLDGSIGYYSRQKKYCKKNGEQIVLNLTISLIRDTHQNPKSIFIMAEDITQAITDKQRQAKHEQILIQQSKMAAMGEMIASIAHQWRQPLNALGLIIQDMQEAQLHGELNCEYMDNSVTRSMGLLRHMSSTIDDFRNFFKPDKQKERFCLKQSVESAIELLGAQLGEHSIATKIVCPDYLEDATVWGYQNEFKQVLLNLISNAKDALESAEAENPTIVIEISGSKENLQLSVKDNAGGVPPTILQRVFEPYFTTKEQGKGTGIGLYMSKLIIEENMGGSLNVHNVDNGAAFVIGFCAH